ncbi:MAG TPA: hypothetical protein VJZ04_02750 [Lachnospiraceae bacterium]|nr:hypothetical protein [Lachnospiraceae bacterium]
MKSVINVLNFVYENYILIATAALLVFGIYNRVKNMTLEKIRLIMLDLVTKAEINFKNGTGSIKKSEVSNIIFEKFPILTKITTIAKLETIIDKLINEALIELREKLDTNDNFYKFVYGKDRKITK